MNFIGKNHFRKSTGFFVLFSVVHISNFHEPIILLLPFSDEFSKLTKLHFLSKVVYFWMGFGLDILQDRPTLTNILDI